LQGKGLWDAVAPKVVPTENVRGALAAVESGNAEASIVYQSDALISKNVVIAYRVPLEQGPEIRYPAAVVRGTKDPSASWRFLEFLASDSAIRIFERRGFAVIQ
jgi:molybdate transport system substrate-binding protein